MSTTQRLSINDAWRRRLFLPAYSVGNAARYAQTARQTVSYWHHRGGRLGPALPGKERRQPLSYMQLVEVAFVATFRGLGVTLQRLRKAHEYLAQVFEEEFPFATLRLKTEGYHVLVDMQEAGLGAYLGQLIIADRHGQMAWEEHIGDRFAEFDYEHDLALVWHPAGRQSKVLIDPRISFGAPIVSGVPTWALKGRYVAGENPDEIAEDFGLSRDDVVEALSFENVKDVA